MIKIVDVDYFMGRVTVSSSFHYKKTFNLETDNSVSNLSRNGIPNGLETEFSVLKMLVRENSVSNQRRIFLSLIGDGFCRL